MIFKRGLGWRADVARDWTFLNEYSFMHIQIPAEVQNELHVNTNQITNFRKW